MKRKFKIKSILIISVLVLSTGNIVGCNSSSGTESTSIAVTTVHNNEYYKEIGQEAASKLKATATVNDKYAASYDAIYQAIFKEESDVLSQGIDVTDEEIEEYINNKDNKNLAKIYTFKSDEGNSFEYRTFTDIDESYTVGETVLGSTVIDCRDATEAEKEEYANISVKSTKLVDIINNKVKEILN